MYGSERIDVGTSLRTGSEDRTVSIHISGSVSGSDSMGGAISGSFSGSDSDTISVPTYTLVTTPIRYAVGVSFKVTYDTSLILGSSGPTTSEYASDVISA